MNNDNLRLYQLALCNNGEDYLEVRPSAPDKMGLFTMASIPKETVLMTVPVSTVSAALSLFLNKAIIEQPERSVQKWVSNHWMKEFCINHSFQPNAKVNIHGQVVTLCYLCCDEEVLINYHHHTFFDKKYDDAPAISTQLAENFTHSFAEQNAVNVLS